MDGAIQPESATKKGCRSSPFARRLPLWAATPELQLEVGANLFQQFFAHAFGADDIIQLGIGAAGHNGFGKRAADALDGAEFSSAGGVDRNACGGNCSGSGSGNVI